MTTITTVAGGTTTASTGEWLLTDDDEVRGRVSTVVAKTRDDPRPAVRRIGLLAGAARLTLAAEICRRLREALGDDLVDLLVGGLARHEALRDAARSTLAEPGSESIVSLDRYRVATHQQPSVDIYVDQARLITLECEVDIDFLVADVRGTVRAGRLVALGMPRPEVRGMLRVHGQEIYRNHGTLLVASRLDLDSGVPLLSRREREQFVAGDR